MRDQRFLRLRRPKKDLFGQHHHISVLNRDVEVPIDLSIAHKVSGFGSLNLRFPEAGSGRNTILE